MLGFLYESSGNVSPTGEPFDGLKGTESNLDDAGRQVQVFKIDPQMHAYLMPGGIRVRVFQHELSAVLHRQPGSGQAPTNDGFVVNFKAAIASDFAKGFPDTLPGTVPMEIMGMLRIIASLPLRSTTSIR